MVKIGILDDEVIICETISKYLRELGYTVPEYAMNYAEGIELLEQQHPDIMLLDINIGGEKNGVDLALHIREKYNIPLIFISSYSDKSTIESAKKAQPNGYLVKPFSKEDLYVAIEVSLNNFAANTSPPKKNELNQQIKLLNDAIFIKQDSLYTKIYFKDILYIKSEGVYAEFYSKEKKYLIRETLKNLIEILPSDSFFLTHRSYIVNINAINAVNSEYVIIENESIPISRAIKDDFLKRLNLI
ncbi:MAG: response regulator [Bacteroidia bacterium]|nr:response regulator [Bacteroidia bacterium]